MKNSMFGWLRRGAVLAVVIFLSACASNKTFTVQQEVFQQQGGTGSGGSYYIKASPSQDLERSSYETMLQQVMPRTGLYQARSERTADYLVDFRYFTEQRQQLVQDQHYEPFFYPTFGMYYGRGGYRRSGMMFHTAYYPTYSVRQVNYNLHSLQVLISRRDDGRNVYQSTVRASSQAPLVQVMPYLMAAVFDGYPGQSAAVREVKFDLSAPGGGLYSTASTEQATPEELKGNSNLAQ